MVHLDEEADGLSTSSFKSRASRWLVAGSIAAALTGVIVWALARWVGFPAVDRIDFLWSGDAYFLGRPEALYLTLLISLFVLIQGVGMSLWSRTQSILQILLRSALIAALAIALAIPTSTETDVNICASYVVDHSASVSSDWLEAATSWVQESIDAAGDFERHVVQFAAEPSLVEIGGTGSFTLSPAEPAAALTTNIESALKSGAASCPAAATRRLVLLSDGLENSGSALRAASTLRESGMEISAVALDSPQREESFLAAVDFPDAIDVSEPFQIEIDVFSSSTVTGRLAVVQNEIREPTHDLSLEPGLNHILIPTEVPLPGVRRYSFTLDTDGPDYFSENNVWNEEIRVEGRPHVLYIEGQSRARHYLQRAVDRDRNDLANFDLEVRGAWSVPATLEEMENYDAIILSDVAAEFVSDRAMRNLEQYVRQLGGGLILVGGEDSFGPGGFEGTRIEDISPVEFDIERGREEPSLAMLLVMDRSGSMQGTKLEMAKDAASAVVDMLGPQDFVGVISFDSQPETNVRLQQVSARNRIRQAIGRIAPGGGTDIYPALEEAYLQLLAQPARMHHMILLTDGQAPWDGISALTSSMRADGISVSTVGVGSSADRSLLQMIAELGNGRFYATSDPSNIPRIFVQEAARVSRSAFEENPIRAIPTGRSSATRGIDWASAPYLLGYVKTRAKRGARVALTSDSGDPILASWRLGLGQVVVFTSDVKNRWAVEWVRTSIYPQFWAQLIRSTMRFEEDSPWTVDISSTSAGAVLRVDALTEAGLFINGATVSVDLRAPSGEQLTIPLPQVAPGRYQATTALREFGTYEAATLVEDSENTDGAPTTSFTRPFPEEFQVTGTNTQLLQRIAEAGGGAWNPAPSDVWDTTGAEQTVYIPHWRWPTMVALILLVLDVLFRRIRLFTPPARSWESVTRS